MPQTAAAKGVRVPLLSAATTGTGTGVAVPITSNYPRVELEGSGTISGGTVLIESAPYPDFAGAWGLVDTITATDLTAGACLTVHIFATFGALRCRISSNITGGGNVTANLVSN